MVAVAGKILSGVVVAKIIKSNLPPTVVTNADLSKTIDTSDEWITSRTGIKERRAPMAFCNMVAVAGKILSGVVVAKIIKSNSLGAMPAISSALLVAITAKSQVVSLVTLRLSLMPVLLVIHSSDVSIVLDRSALVTTVGGK
jgi:hypothetical protein